MLCRRGQCVRFTLCIWNTQSPEKNEHLLHQLAQQSCEQNQSVGRQLNIPVTMQNYQATHHCPNLKQHGSPHHLHGFLSTVVCLHSFSTTLPRDDFIVHTQTKEFAFTHTHCLPYTLYSCRFIQLTISKKHDAFPLTGKMRMLFPLLLAQQIELRSYNLTICKSSLSQKSV